MKTFSFIFLFSIFLELNFVTPANILVWQAVGTVSTRISMWPFVESLAEQGHNVSFISMFKESESTKNSSVHYIVPKKLHEAMGSTTGWEDQVNFFEIRKIPFGIVKSWYDVRDFGVSACQLLYADEEFLSWATSPDTKFDLVIVEISVNDCAYGLVHLWKSKLVIYSTTTVMPLMIGSHGLPDESSSISDFLFGFQNPMTFPQRFVNALNPILYSLTREWMYFPKLEAITRKALGPVSYDFPAFADIEKNASLVLLTTHFSYETARSLPPNVKSIGGAVVVKEAKPLPKEMNDFINSGKKGFIYISFGTVTAFTHFDLHLQLEFIKALKSFPEMRFIWKSTKEINATSLPENVLVTKWAPQQAILAHPKIKAFISHAGMGSTTEAVHFSVPMICFPIMMDQDLNANVIDARGAGIKIEILTLTSPQLENAINEILHNNRIKDGMARMSRLFKDRPLPPVQEAVWWIEYVLRHENIHEILTPSSAFQHWWTRRQLDVWFTFGLLLLALTLGPFYIIKFAITKLLFKSRGSEVKKLKKS